MHASKRSRRGLNTTLVVTDSHKMKVTDAEGMFANAGLEGESAPARQREGAIEVALRFILTPCHGLAFWQRKTHCYSWTQSWKPSKALKCVCAAKAPSLHSTLWPMAVQQKSLAAISADQSWEECWQGAAWKVLPMFCWKHKHVEFFLSVGWFCSWTKDLQIPASHPWELIGEPWRPDCSLKAGLHSYTYILVDLACRAGFLPQHTVSDRLPAGRDTAGSVPVFLG